MTQPNLTGDGRTVTVRISISIHKRGGRKLVLAPDGTPDTSVALWRGACCAFATDTNDEATTRAAVAAMMDFVIIVLFPLLGSHRVGVAASS